MSRPTLMRALAALVLSLTACGPSRVELSPRPLDVIHTAALSCPPAPAPVCPAAPVLECPPPPVCPPPPEPPAPVELSFSATAIEPLRAELQVEWHLRGCTPSEVEILGEAGQVVSIYHREPVPVVNVSRPGAPMIERLGLWVRVTCDDGRAHVAGPFIVTDVLRASQVVTLQLESGRTVEHLTALPNGGLVVMTGLVAANDPTVTLNQFCAFKPDGTVFPRCEGMRQHVTGEPRADHPWIEGTRVVAAPVPGALRAWIDYETGAVRSSHIDHTPLPPEATIVPVRPAALQRWEGTWAPAVGDPGRAWVERAGVVALVSLGG
ncbi:hypothetical protein [Archangium lansingense]|uniref:Lipoprotein n=1 Tax=Archangium lansingense TaxID=2995310 RepID=A0ABT4A6W9_9BACT|nr:hypothetical protein [Archangium lansinium]MCY1077413.1 hypothetical protein [Archangium lansinium]